MNEFVIYPLASRMKALGFNEPCMGVFGYNETGDKFFLISDLDEGYLTPKDLINSNIGDDVSAPTWQSAFAWFKTEHQSETTTGYGNLDVDSLSFYLEKLITYLEEKKAKKSK